MTSPLESMILKSVRCTICGAGYGQCGCWSKCLCGWSYRTSKGPKSCNNPIHGGNGKQEIVAMAGDEK